MWGAFGSNGKMITGGGMFRPFHRAVRVGGGGAQESFSHSAGNSSSSTVATSTTRRRPTASDILSLSSWSFPAPVVPASPTWQSCSSPTASDEFSWESIDGSEFERANSDYDDFVFGGPPSGDEVQEAVSALQQFINTAPCKKFANDSHASDSDSDVLGESTLPRSLENGFSSVETYSDWIEPSLQLCNPKMMPSCGYNTVYDAFHMLGTDPSIQRMVFALSSDRAVWNAVLNNEVVQEVKDSLLGVDKGVPGNSDDSSDISKAASNILSWILDNTKAKAIELIEKIIKLVSAMFQSLKGGEATRGDMEPFEGKLQASFMLSIVVLLIVVVGRAHRA